MSQMSEVHACLVSLGSRKVRKIENFVNGAKANPYYEIVDPEELEDLVIETYKIDKNTAIMIIAGAKKYQCSSMLEREEWDERG